MPEVRLRSGALDGLALHYLAAGRGPAVVLVHGLAGFAASWRHNMAALAGQATVYAVDLPGSGRSAKPRVRYDLAHLANAVGGFLDALDLGTVSLVGHSLGGAVCVALALCRPTRVDRLALVGALVPGFAYRPPGAARPLAVPVLGEALTLLGCAPLYRWAIRRCFHDPRPGEVEFLVSHDYAVRAGAAARAAYVAVVRELRREFVTRQAAYRRAVGGLDAPVLLVHGRQDRVVPPAHCAEAAAGLPGARARWVDACGHFPHIEHAALVNTWLGEFLAGRPAPSGR